MLSSPLNEMKPVIGETAFGNQCPYGSIADPRPVRLGLWDCPIDVKTLELIQPPTALIFSADCYKKTLAIRTLDRKMDTLWEVMPDGSFDLTLDGGTLLLKTDGAGHSPCLTHTIFELWGRLKCTDRDRLTIQVDTVWHLGKSLIPVVIPSPSPFPSVSPSPPAARPVTPQIQECKLPESCYLHAAVPLQQCQ